MSDLNFFSQYINSQRTAEKKLLLILTGLVCIIAMLGAVYGLTEINVRTLQSEINESREYLNSTEVINGKKKIQEKRQEQELLEQYDAAVTEIKGKIDDSDKVRSETIAKINETLPGSVKVLNINLSQQTINIGGTAADRIQIAELEHNLLETGLFHKVHIGAIDSDEISGIFSFNVDCTLKEVIEK